MYTLISVNTDNALPVDFIKNQSVSFVKLFHLHISEFSFTNYAKQIFYYYSKVPLLKHVTYLTKFINSHYKKTCNTPVKY